MIGWKRKSQPDDNSLYILRALFLSLFLLPRPRQRRCKEQQRDNPAVCQRPYSGHGIWTKTLNSPRSHVYCFLHFSDTIPTGLHYARTGMAIRTGIKGIRAIDCEDELNTLFDNHASAAVKHTSLTLLTSSNQSHCHSQCNPLLKWPA